MHNAQHGVGTTRHVRSLRESHISDGYAGSLRLLQVIGLAFAASESSVGTWCLCIRFEFSINSCFARLASAIAADSELSDVNLDAYSRWNSTNMCGPILYFAESEL